MFTRILVPTDGSVYSRNALNRATEIAKKLGSEIYLLHVTFSPEALGYSLSKGITLPQDQLNINGEAVLRDALIGIDLDQIKITTILRPGYPAVVILEEIISRDIDLVVMGSRGYGPITGSLLGSVSQKVLNKAECPVMIVK